MYIGYALGTVTATLRHLGTSKLQPMNIPQQGVYIIVPVLGRNQILFHFIF